MKRPKPIYTMRAYPEIYEPCPSVPGLRVSRLYARVHVFRTRTDMRRWWKTRYGAVPNAEGVCVWVTSGSSCFAVVGFTKGRVCGELVSHEIFHATMAWVRRAKVKLWHCLSRKSVTATEERVAYAHGAMVRQVVNRLHAKGLV